MSHTPSVGESFCVTVLTSMHGPAEEKPMELKLEEPVERRKPKVTLHLLDCVSACLHSHTLCHTCLHAYCFVVHWLAFGCTYVSTFI